MEGADAYDGLVILRVRRPSGVSGRGPGHGGGAGFRPRREPRAGRVGLGRIPRTSSCSSSRPASASPSPTTRTSRSRSRAWILPHQLEAVYERMLPQARLRFLLADDPGAGKTIMAGLLIKELRLRGVADRVLVLCPAPLTIQWQDELREKFDETFEHHRLADGRSEQLGREPVAAVRPVHRLDRLREAGRGPMTGLLRADWDLVVIDEAHKCSARHAGTATSVEKLDRPALPARRAALAADRAAAAADRDAALGRRRPASPIPPAARPGPVRGRRPRPRAHRAATDSPWFLRRQKEDLKDFDGTTALLAAPGADASRSALARPS